MAGTLHKKRNNACGAGYRPSTVLWDYSFLFYFGCTFPVLERNFPPLPGVWLILQIPKIQLQLRKAGAMLVPATTKPNEQVCQANADCRPFLRNQQTQLRAVLLASGGSDPGWTCTDGRNPFRTTVHDNSPVTNNIASMVLMVPFWGRCTTRSSLFWWGLGCSKCCEMDFEDPSTVVPGAQSILLRPKAPKQNPSEAEKCRQKEAHTVDGSEIHFAPL